ncbi:hypothetical protein F4814DRAFT_238578 [Daldinia grandis]|nr:hypothetical protein F4814DRAFT_238578 [Daldinia grandis]
MTPSLLAGYSFSPTVPSPLDSTRRFAASSRIRRRPRSAKVDGERRLETRRGGRRMFWSQCTFLYRNTRPCKREIESAEGHLIEALNAWMRGDNNRLHQFNAGILYKIGACCLG